MKDKGKIATLITTFWFKGLGERQFYLSKCLLSYTLLMCSFYVFRLKHQNIV